MIVMEPYLTVVLILVALSLVALFEAYVSEELP